ncbi:hypothetical protein HYW76_04440 [Candidatus Pacearchaeota archaeon]|nr:hypothetical protein [Candidatus Pacearchaeota archaeon]
MAKRKKRVVKSRRIVRKKSNIGLAVLSLILNIIILPGLGTLIGKRIKEGITQIVLSLGSIIILLVLNYMNSAFSDIAIPLFMLVLAISWLWGILSGVKLIRAAE